MVDVRTACQQACPTDAIVFGNANDKDSQIRQVRGEQADRLFYVIEETHTMPNVNYLAKVRNTDVIRGVEEEKKEDAAADKHA